MKRIIARYYHALKSRDADVPYVTTIFLFAFLIILHWFQIVGLFDLPRKFYKPVVLQNPIADRWVNSLIVFTPVIIVSFLVFKKNDLERYKFTNSELKRGYRNTIIYGVVSMLFVFALIIRKGIKLGTI